VPERMSGSRGLLKPSVSAPAPLSTTVMHQRKCVIIGIGAAGLMGVLWLVVSRSSCPVVLTIVGKEPSGMMQEDEAEFQILTLRMRNCTAGRLTFADDGIRAEAKVRNQWVAANPVSKPLDVGSYGDLMVLVPSGAEGCRLGISYLPEPPN